MSDTVFPKLLNNVFLILAVPLSFNLQIVVHELGHFLAARWRGLLVSQFRVRFRKLILRKKLGGFSFRLAASSPAA